MSHTIDSTRRYVESFLAALKDCGHEPENVRAVLRDLLGEPDAALRDEFAMAAMAALIAEPVSGSQSATQYLAATEAGDAYVPGVRIARAAYVMADAMLRARSGT